jgi:phage terminase large subunit GpA-like protein
MNFHTLQELIAATASGVRPPERLTVAEAAEKYRFLNNPGSYVGYWDNAIAPYLVEPMETLTSTDYTGMIFAGPARTGKALAVNTPVPTPSGWVVMGDLKEGDEVFGSDGESTRVMFKSEVFHGHDCYRLTFSDGGSIVADAGHKWSVVDSANQNVTRVLTTEYMASRVTYRAADPRNRFLVAESSPLQFTAGKSLPLHPYIFGLWLGDGHNIGARIATSAQDVEELRQRVEECGFQCRTSVCESGKHTLYLSPKRHNPGRRGGSDEVSAALQSMGMLKAARKYIPDVYLTASEEDRLALLQGLFDTDGHADKRGRVEFCNTEYSLVTAVRQILWSLGIKSYLSVKQTTGRDAYLVCFTPGDRFRLFRFERKQARLGGLTQRGRVAVGRRSIVSIEKAASVPTQCISVAAADSLFVAGESCVLTHNSDMFFNWLLYTAKCDPADMMHVLMTMNVARDWSQKDLRRAFRHSKELGKTVAPGRHNQSTHDIRFLSGMHLLVKWPTITELSGKTVGRNWISDYDRIPESIDGEGNAYDLTAKRATTFRRNGMTVAESSPGFEIEDPKWVARTKHEAPPTRGILALYNRGDRRRWYWRCPHCVTPFEPDFNLLQYPDSADHVEAAEAAVMACPHCGGIIWHDGEHGVPGKNELNQIDLGNANWVRDGQIWTPRQAIEGNNRGIIEGTPYRSDQASFWLKGPAASFTNWRDLVLKYLKADEEYERTGSQESLKTTVNTDQGLPFKPRGMDEGRNWEDVKSLASDLGVRVVPLGVRFLLALIDVQAGRFEVQIVGVGVGGDMTVIDRFAIKKSARLDEDGERERVKPATYLEDWHLLIEHVILKSYPLGDGSGRHMPIRMAGCDSGGAADKKNDSSTTKVAYEFWRALRDSDGTKFPTGLHNRFRLLKGSSNKSAPRVQLNYPDSERKDRTAGARGEIPVLMINTTALKDQLNSLLDRRTPGHGKINFPNWLPDEFWQEMVAEVRTSDGWDKISPRNEAWDLLVYAIAISLHRPIKIEHMDWEDCPGWAAEWDDNDLVFNPTLKSNPNAGPKVKEMTLEELAQALT